MSTHKIVWHKGSYWSTYTNNGLDLVNDDGYISAAVGKHYNGDTGRYEGYMLRIWGRRGLHPVKAEWFKLQSEAKAVGTAVLLASRTEAQLHPRELTYWLQAEYHDIHMAALYAAEGYTYPRTARV